MPVLGVPTWSRTRWLTCSSSFPVVVGRAAPAAAAAPGRAWPRPTVPSPRHALAGSRASVAVHRVASARDRLAPSARPARVTHVRAARSGTTSGGPRASASSGRSRSGEQGGALVGGCEQAAARPLTRRPRSDRGAGRRRAASRGGARRAGRRQLRAGSSTTCTRSGPTRRAHAPATAARSVRPGSRSRRGRRRPSPPRAHAAVEAAGGPDVGQHPSEVGRRARPPRAGRRPGAGRVRPARRGPASSELGVADQVVARPPGSRPAGARRGLGSAGGGEVLGEHAAPTRSSSSAGTSAGSTGRGPNGRLRGRADQLEVRLAAAHGAGLEHPVGEAG